MKLIGLGLIAWALWRFHKKGGVGLLPSTGASGIVGGASSYQDPGLGQALIVGRVTY